MQSDNNATRIRRELLVKIAKLFFEGKLQESIDRLPIQMRPKNSVTSRCCVHKERAVLKYRGMAILGFGAEDEADELISLSEYANCALSRESVKEPILTVIDEACSSCVKSKYFITNACKGCFARPCTLNCPRKCIDVVDGQARIDASRCANCGKCMQVCPYHAIVFVPIPCEEECPVGAITRLENGLERIDHDKCIHCGKCMSVCPFGAIMEKSQIIDVMKYFTSQRPVVAMVAPSIVGQFDAPLGSIISALKLLGFSEVVEVAVGADIVADREAKEFVERIGGGEKFMTSSCCSAYTEAAEKHMPELKPFVSHTDTPMHCTAEIVAQQYPDAVKVFIGPCAAKKQEALNDPYVDYVLTFEELGTLFVAKGIDVESCEPVEPAIAALSYGRKFPVSGGVSSAVQHMLEGDIEHPEFRPTTVNGLTKQEIRRPKMLAKGSTEHNFIEVMCCEGGCVAGPCVLASSKMAAKKIDGIRS